MNRLLAEESSDSYAVEGDKKESAPDKEIIGDDDKEVGLNGNNGKSGAITPIPSS